MVPNTAAADFASVQHHVIGLGPDLQRLRVQERQIFVHRRGKGIVHEDVAFFFRRIIQQGKLGHPQRLPCGLVDQIQLLAQQQPDPAQHIMDDGRLIGAEED